MTFPFMTFDEMQRKLLTITRSEGLAVAERWLYDVMTNHPDPEVRNNAVPIWVGTAMTLSGGDTVERFDMLQEIYPKLQDPYAKIAAIQQIMVMSIVYGDRERIQQYVEWAKDLMKSPIALHWRGRFFISLCMMNRFYGDLEQAEEHVKLANEMHRRPNYGPYDKADRLSMLTLGMMTLGDIYLATGRLAEASALLPKLPKEVNSNLSRAHLLRAKVALAKGNLRNYQKAMSAAVAELEKRPEEMLQLQIMEVRIREKMLKQEYEEARVLIDEAEELATARRYHQEHTLIQAHRLRLKEVTG